MLLIMGVFVLLMNAQQNQWSNADLNTAKNIDYLNRAKKRVGFGATFTLLGVAGMIGGAIIFVNVDYGIDYNQAAENKELGGIALMAIGEVMFDVGLPFWIVGGIQKGKAERNLKFGMVQFKTPNNHASINGIGLKIRF